MQNDNEKLAREYIVVNMTYGELDKKLKVLKPKIREILSGIKTIGGGQYINIDDQSISLRYSKPTRELNKDGLAIALKREYPKLAKLILQEKKVYEIDEAVLENFILTKDIPKEFLNDYIKEKAKEPSIIVGKTITEEEDQWTQ
jgi:hypothetical protein